MTAKMTTMEDEGILELIGRLLPDLNTSPGYKDAPAGPAQPGMDAHKLVELDQRARRDAMLAKQMGGPQVFDATGPEFAPQTFDATQSSSDGWTEWHGPQGPDPRLEKIKAILKAVYGPLDKEIKDRERASRANAAMRAPEPTPPPRVF